MTAGVRDLGGDDSLEPWLRLETLEDISRFADERSRLVFTSMSNEQLGELELRHGEVERHRQLSEEADRASEEALGVGGVAVKRCDPCLESPTLGAEELRVLPGRELLDRCDQALGFVDLT